jgi:formylglycine-generating enzyme required for sulfatase activity
VSAVFLLLGVAAFGSPSSGSGRPSDVEGTSAAPPASEQFVPEDEDLDGTSPDSPGRDRDEEEDGEQADESELEVSSESLSAGDAGTHKPKRGGCPANMVRAQNFCIDRYEAPNRRGARPLVMQSANDAVSWCAEHRKRLCTEDEWIAACEGDDHRPYPYGETHVDGRCNDDKPWRKVDEATLAKWPAPEARALAKELYQATPSGWKRKCTSAAGARDMTGNVEEWVVRTRDHENDWPYLLIGCYWSGCYGGNKPTCHSTNDAHGPEFRFYETGFRCCRDAR